MSRSDHCASGDQDLMTQGCRIVNAHIQATTASREGIRDRVMRDRYRGSLMGLACGDAVGTIVEFKPRGTISLVSESNCLTQGDQTNT